MLPENFVKEGIKLANGSMLFGVRFEDMTREELIAAAAHGWNEERKQREAFAETAKARAHWVCEKARRSA